MKMKNNITGTGMFVLASFMLVHIDLRAQEKVTNLESVQCYSSPAKNNMAGSLTATALTATVIATQKHDENLSPSKVWFITGANRGIGLGIARAALAAGDRVVATARKPEQALAALPGYGDKLLVVALDITNNEQIEAAAIAAKNKFGRIDVLVNVAGYGQLGYFENSTDEQIRKQFDTNVFGTMNVTRAILPIMRSQRSGHIITISSIAGLTVTAGSSVYGSTKFALEGWMEGLAAEVMPLGISSTLVEPGYFRTDFLDPSSVSWGALNIEDYAAVTKEGIEGAEKMNHKQIGDPAKLGTVVVELVGMATPPLRFAAGTDAYKVMLKKAGELHDNAEHLRVLSGSTDGTWQDDK